MKHKVHQQYYCIKYRALALRVGQDVIHNKMKHKVHQQQYYRALALIVDQGVILNSTTWNTRYISSITVLNAEPLPWELSTASTKGVLKSQVVGGSSQFIQDATSMRASYILKIQVHKYTNTQKPIFTYTKHKYASRQIHEYTSGRIPPILSHHTFCWFVEYVQMFPCFSENIVVGIVEVLTQDVILNTVLLLWCHTLHTMYITRDAT